MIIDTEKNPWTTTGTSEIYKNHWIRLREDQVIRPDGKNGIYCVVEARNAATGVIALDEQGNIVLVGQYRYPVEEYSWEIIEGGAEEGETPLQAIQRELSEEAGLTADKWRPLGGEVLLSNCFSDERGYLFVAEGLHSVGEHPEGTEVLQIKKVPFEEAYQMVMSGEIKDGMSVIALMRFKLEMMNK